MTDVMLINRVSFEWGCFLWDVGQKEGTMDIYINKTKTIVDLDISNSYKRVLIDSIVLEDTMSNINQFKGSYNDKYISYFKYLKKGIFWNDLKDLLGDLVDGDSDGNGDSDSDGDSDDDYYRGDIDKLND
jgi:hypothetical protein